MRADLIIRLREDGESCFREIYDLYAFKVYCFVKKYIKQLADAKDATQNVFIYLWNYRNKLNPKFALESVLFKSSKQEISKWYQKQNRILTTEKNGLFPKWILPTNRMRYSTPVLNRSNSCYVRFPKKTYNIYIIQIRGAQL
ncbi:RNA polymerase sigma factor [Flavobacterium supellecticarium]|uniref:RNA polymerase sigma factor n=1 Tax=Flavobacterium supellecticarium TaxID=2565924 RepID=UPI001E4061F1|nr:hypothetical protein [Flavobacterium supellecticarium]